MKTTPIAHRGLHSNTLPENSLGALRAAIEAGFPVETDVRITKDGVLVIFHDETLLRMTGDKRRVRDCTLCELRALRLMGSGEKIPLLSEYLETLSGRTPLLLEIKNEPHFNKTEFAGRISAAFSGYCGKYAVQSFNPFYLAEYRKLRPEIPCGVLACANSTKQDFGGSLFWRIKAHAVKHMSFNKKVKPDFISYCVSDYPQKETERFEGLKLAWTVRNSEDEAYARKYADNIIFENYLPL